MSFNPAPNSTTKNSKCAKADHHFCCCSYGEFFLHYHRVEQGEFRIFADRSTPADTEVFEDYGDNPNSVYVTLGGGFDDLFTLRVYSNAIVMEFVSCHVDICSTTDLCQITILLTVSECRYRCVQTVESCPVLSCHVRTEH